MILTHICNKTLSFRMENSPRNSHNIDLNPRRLLPGAVLISPAANPIFLVLWARCLITHRDVIILADLSASLDISGPGVLGECAAPAGQDDLVLPPSSTFSVFAYTAAPYFMLDNGQGHSISLLNGTELIRLMPGGAKLAITSILIAARENTTLRCLAKGKFILQVISVFVICRGLLFLRNESLLEIVRTEDS